MAKTPGTLGKGDVYQVDPESLVITQGWNRRKDMGDLEGLSLSIEENGVRTPLILRRLGNGGLEVLAGERRLRATLLAIGRGNEIVSIPAFIKPKHFSDMQALVEMALENDGKRFTPSEMATIYQQFLDWGWSQAAIAKKFGVTPGHVSNTLLYLEATPKLIEEMERGDLSTKQVLRVVRESRKADNPKEAQAEIAVNEKAKKVEHTKAALAKKKGINQTYVRLLQAEVRENFTDLEGLKDKEFVNTTGLYSPSENHAYLKGRLAIICELCGPDKGIEDLEELFGSIE